MGVPNSFSGGQEHAGQVQRCCGEKTSYSGGARIRLRVRDHQQLIIRNLSKL